MTMDDSKLRLKIIEEAKRLEYDALHSFKGHFNAANVWEKIHLLLGCIAAVAATFAGASIFAKAGGNWIYLTGTLGLLAGVITAVITFVDPNKKANIYRNAGADNKHVRDQSRILYEIKCHSDSSVTELTEELEALREKYNELSKEYPVIPTWAYKKAKEGVNRGEASYN